jgi:hypothetical protein
MTFADQLEGWLKSDDAKTLGAMERLFAEKTFATTIFFLMFVPALPLPTGGVTVLFETMAMVVAAQMVIGRRTLWIPARWKDRELGELTTGRAIPFMARWVRRFERFSQPRAPRLFDQGLSLRILGLLLMALAIASALAPPFSGLDTVPAVGAVIVALSIILEDVVVLAVGVVVGLVGIGVILAIGAAIVEMIGRVL